MKQWRRQRLAELKKARQQKRLEDEKTEEPTEVETPESQGEAMSNEAETQDLGADSNAICKSNAVKSPTSSKSSTSGSDKSSDEEEDDGKEKLLSEKDKRKWFQGTWPVEKFDEKTSIGERKAEWMKFKEQFKRVVKSKGAATDKMKINALEIYSGSYLLSVIQTLKLNSKSTKKRFDKLIKALDEYFNATFDKEMERVKLAEMHQKESEAFSDWTLRLQKQVARCRFNTKRQLEEMRGGLCRRSKPVIANKLMEQTNAFGKDLNKFIKHGNLLDNIEQSQANELKVEKKEEEGEEKPVNAVWEKRKEKKSVLSRTHRDRLVNSKK